MPKIKWQRSKDHVVSSKCGNWHIEPVLKFTNKRNYVIGYLLNLNGVRCCPSALVQCADFKSQKEAKEHASWMARREDSYFADLAGISESIHQAIHRRKR